MKIKNFPAYALCVLASPLLGLSQTSTPSKPLVSVALQVVPSADPLQRTPTYKLPVAWDEKGTTVLTVPFKNESSKVLGILGIQATRGLFVGDFPLTIAAGKEDNIAFVYSAPDNTDGDLDVIRVLTDQGIHEINVKIDREKAITASATTLKWTQGAATVPLTVDLTVKANTAVPKKLRIMGEGNKADLLNLGQGRYRVVVTPASTAKAHAFAVFIDYEPAVPGAVAVIYCEITPRD